MRLMKPEFARELRKICRNNAENLLKEGYRVQSRTGSCLVPVEHGEDCVNAGICIFILFILRK